MEKAKQANKANKARMPEATPGSLLCERERQELERQGAKSAARGDRDPRNPMDDPANMPAVTGESEALWAERKAAWQAGFDAHKAGARTRMTNPEGKADYHDRD